MLLLSAVTATAGVVSDSTLRQDLDAADLAGLDVRVSLVTVGYQPLPG